MKRNYQLMHDILLYAQAAKEPFHVMKLSSMGDVCRVYDELERLNDEGLLGVSFITTEQGDIIDAITSSITAEGKEFCRLIDNQRVWKLISETLEKADIDILYPLLKEVCETVVKRYVMGCIPENI